MENNQTQVDLKNLSVEELWKLAYEQQKLLVQLISQMNMVQTNIQVIEKEIETRKEEK